MVTVLVVVVVVDVLSVLLVVLTLVVKQETFAYVYLVFGGGRGLKELTLFS